MSNDNKRITGLFVKSEHSKELDSVPRIEAGSSGIFGNVDCHSFRQILIVNTKTLSRFNLSPGDLRENVLVEDDQLYAYDSGTQIRIGGIGIRLTFHCEPCVKVKELANPRILTHNRGYLGSIVAEGTASLGDLLKVEGQNFDKIPYAPIERVKWYLDSQAEPVSALQLVRAVALRTSYCRVLPRYLKKLGTEYQRLVVFQNGKKSCLRRPTSNRAIKIY